MQARERRQVLAARRQIFAGACAAPAQRRRAARAGRGAAPRPRGAAARSGRGVAGRKAEPTGPVQAATPAPPALAPSPLPAPVAAAATPAERAFATGWSALRRSDFAGSAAAFRQAVAAGAGEPLLEDARFWLGVALARGGSREAAIAALRDFVAITRARPGEARPSRSSAGSSCTPDAAARPSGCSATPPATARPRCSAAPAPGWPPSPSPGTERCWLGRLNQAVGMYWRGAGAPEVPPAVQLQIMTGTWTAGNSGPE